MIRKNYMLAVPVITMFVTSLLTFSVGNIGSNLSSPINTIEVTVSPYKKEIDKIVDAGKVSISPAQSRKLDELVDKNNRWWAETGKHTFKKIRIRSSERRRYLLLPLFVLWFSSIYFLIRYNLNYSLTVPFLLVSPVILIMFGRVLFNEFLFIYISLFLGWTFGKLGLWLAQKRLNR